jgi:hypothetical protein
MKSLLVSLILISSYTLFAQDKTLKDLSEVQSLSKKSAELFSKKEVGKALDMLKPYWPLPSEELKALQAQTSSQLDYVEENFGKPFATTKVKEKLLGDVAYREVYFVQYDHMAIRLMFTYYKNEKGWMLYAFKWDDAFASELDSEEFTK